MQTSVVRAAVVVSGSPDTKGTLRLKWSVTSWAFVSIRSSVWRVDTHGGNIAELVERCSVVDRR